MPLVDDLEEAYPERTFDECMGDHLHGWAFIQTKHGSLGWVPQTACVGDLVCIADGSPLPIILRKAGSELQLKARDWILEDVYELIGTAYIHDEMDRVYESEDIFLV
jgi:hypothetical protein